MRRSAPKASLRALSVVFVLLSGLLVVEPGGAIAGSPDSTLELVTSADHVTLERFRREPVYLDLGLFLASPDEPFVLLVTRPDYAQPIQVQRVIPDPGNPDQLVDLPGDILNSWAGLADFIEIEVKNESGEVVDSTTSPFCPNSYTRERIGDAGPQSPGYPESCYSNPFTKGMYWGIDADWAVTALGYDSPPLYMKDGEYTVTVTIAERYVDLFGIDPARATATVDVTVEKVEFDCPKCGGRHKAASNERPSAVPTVDDPDPSQLPDLLALPAWGINVDHRGRRQYLTFGANVWNGGAASLVVEGFRRSDEDVMDAFQYFYTNGVAVGKSQVGTMEFDSRSGHEHWHFLQFARYSLLDDTQTELIRSKKEAFCLAPTDAIDLTIPNAVLSPSSIGLGSACGAATSLWVREILPLGWGDTYSQYRPGQSFNITNVPNGTYYIEVEANPGDSLFEQSDTNNTEVRMIQIKGKDDNRRVVVPPWNGIDTETGYGGGGKGGF